MEPERACPGATGRDSPRGAARRSRTTEASTEQCASRRPHARDAARETALKALQKEVSELRAQLAESLVREAQARTLARTDSLTRLGNRAVLLEQLQEALSHGAAPAPRVAVLFIDLDGFKAINDRHGHHVGDQLLRIVGQRLLACVRASDAVARLGGDEFACLLRRCGGRARVAQVARKVLDALCEPYQLGGLRVQVRASIGIAIAPDDGIRAAALLERADAAMYRAKRQRSGCTFHSPDDPIALRFDDAVVDVEELSA